MHELVEALARRYHKFPSEVLAESEDLLRHLSIVDPDWLKEVA